MGISTLLSSCVSILDEVGYKTKIVQGEGGDFIIFEASTYFGFIFFFENELDLMSSWHSRERSAIEMIKFSLRGAGEKAWNLYSVFLCGAEGGDISWEIERIEENFALTRKIARIGVKDRIDVENALLPLLPLRTSLKVYEDNFNAVLQSRLDRFPESAVNALIFGGDPSEIVRALETSEV